MSPDVIRIVAGILFVVLVAIIVIRRKKTGVKRRIQ